MLRLEEHFFISDNDPDGDCDHYDRFDAFRLGRHSNFFLHEIYKQMIDHARKN